MNKKDPNFSKALSYTIMTCIFINYNLNTNRHNTPAGLNIYKTREVETNYLANKQLEKDWQ
ncbi:hypothetical protein [Fodinibius sp. SL11]|uniref:hypothetical protein n=1 Tax=Fodinibius sp. SL11 TaxID=3425690 RepID=UPI003F88577A